MAAKKLSPLMILDGWGYRDDTDHGNAEHMVDHATGQPHTRDVAPLAYLRSQSVCFNTSVDGRLSDVAPTLQRLMRLGQPAEMTGTPLSTLD